MVLSSIIQINKPIVYSEIFHCQVQQGQLSLAKPNHTKFAVFYKDINEIINILLSFNNKHKYNNSSMLTQMARW